MSRFLEKPPLSRALTDGLTLVEDRENVMGSSSDGAGSTLEPHESSVPRLYTLVGAEDMPPPPVTTRQQTLPFDELSWENFERLCLRLAKMRGDVTGAVDCSGQDAGTGRMTARQALVQGRLYGTRGQEQQGIDLFVRLPPMAAEGREGATRRYLTLQSRRVANVTATKLRDAVGEFIIGKWAEVSRIFVYATSLAGVRTELADEIENQAAKLAELGIEFEVWDSEQLADQLRENLLLVYDFFGSAWLDSFAGPEAVDAIRDRLHARLDAIQIGALRRQLSNHYRVVFANTDSGMLGLGRDDAPRLELGQRYVIPDVTASSPTEAYAKATGVRALTTPQGSDRNLGTDNPSALSAYRQTQAAMFGRTYLELPGLVADGAWSRSRSSGESISPTATHLIQSQAFVRISAGEWLGSGERHIVIGDPGSGKSTLLRYLILDLLSENPTMPECAQRFGDRLPIWLPFHFFTRRRAEYTGAEASLRATLRAWLEQNDASELWVLVEKALADERLLLIIDGLDEWVSEQAGQTATTAIENFIDERHVAAVASTRPCGIERLRLATEWQFAQLAPLSQDQQRDMALLWFRAKAGQSASNVDSESSEESIQSRQLSMDVDTFLRGLEERDDMRTLAGVPLFLLLLIGLQLAGTALPARRFGLYQLVADTLLRDHPATRAAAAAVATSRPALRLDDVRSVMGRVAFSLQQRGEVGPIRQDALRRDVIEALRDPDHLAMEAASAAHVAGEIVDIAEDELGVLVRQGLGEVGFLHRVLQEQLAAEFITERMAADEQAQVVGEHAGDPRWREVLLAVFWQLRRPAELRALTSILAERAEDGDPAGLSVRELLAEIVFGSSHLPAAEAQRYAEALFDAIEAHPYVIHRQRLLAACTNGLGSPVIRPQLISRLQRWMNPTSGLALRVLVDLPDDDNLTVAVRTILYRELTNEQLPQVLESAQALAARYRAPSRHSDEVRDELTERARQASTAGHMAAALYGLFLGWPHDEQVRSMLGLARGHETRSVRLVALGAIAGVLRGLADGQDRNAPRPLSGYPELTHEERRWLIGQLRAGRDPDHNWQGLYVRDPAKS